MARNIEILYRCSALGRSYRIIKCANLFHIQVTYDRKYHQDIAVCSSFYDARYALALHIYRDVLISTTYA